MRLVWLEVHIANGIFTAECAHSSVITTEKPKALLFTTLEIVPNLIVTSWPLTSRLK